MRRAKEYIFAGDVMQVQVSQRTRAPFEPSPLALYRALRALNPSPYMFYFDFGDHHVVGASPEILVRLEGDTVTLRPIAGTRPRGATPEEDAALAKELLADPKERAEHVMLIDLGRNDVGRVAQIGQRQGHRADGDRALLARDAHRLERRGPAEAGPGRDRRAARDLSRRHGDRRAEGARDADHRRARAGAARRLRGAVGYLGFNGDMDVAIAIRTAVVKDRRLHVQAAAGIVADSDPRSEWQETQHKARALLRAAEMADAVK